MKSGLTLIYLQPGDLLRTRILYPFHISVNYHSSQRVSLSCLLSHKVKNVGVVTVISKQLYIVKVLTRMN